jgi:superfamily II DNA or RNA helicase
MTGEPQLRPYQRDVIARVEATIAASRRRLLLVAPTGSGKTVIAAAIVRDAVDRDQRVLFFSHRREITKQTHQKLYDLGIDAGILQAGFPARPGQPVQVASVQTLHARAIRGSSIDLPPANLVIVDEAHHARAETYQAVLAKYPNAILLGLTATPCRKDGRGLGNVFDVLVECPQVDELVERGFLVPTVVYGPPNPIDLSGVRTQAGDYVETQLSERMNTDGLVGDVVTHWHRHADRRRTIVFAVDVAHSRHLRDEFLRANVWAEHLDGSTPTDERDVILKRIANGETEVVVNCMVLTEGFDCPDVGCIVLARPTKSLGLFRQMAGRGLRPAPGKENLILLDHAGATLQHGFLDDPIAWTLDTDRKATNRSHEARGGTRTSRLCECSKCGAIRVAGERCRACGFLPAAPPRSVEFIDADLARLDRQRRPIGDATPDKARWQRELAYIARERGYRPGWASHKFKEKFGHWPTRKDVAPIMPSAEVRSWVRSRQIAYAKAMAKQGAAA